MPVSKGRSKYSERCNARLLFISNVVPFVFRDNAIREVEDS